MAFKILKILLVGLAALIALSYTFGYSYLFKGIRETYLRGRTGASIDDGSFFPANTIATGKPVPWRKDSVYINRKLPAALRAQLEATHTAALLVAKNGKLLHEEYWDSKTATTPTNSFSMAKAFTVLLTAKALEEKHLKSWDQKLSELYPKFKNEPFGKDVTLRNLAQMEAGLDWKEDYQNPFLPNAKAYYGKSLEEAVLTRSFRQKPGKTFEYQSGATQLLGFALRKVLPVTLSQYASEKFWQPLGMEASATWNTDDFGMEKTFCCLNAIPRDFAKLGQLMLNEGTFQGREILSSETVKLLHTPTALSNNAYGYGFWVNTDVALPHYYFRGLYGQFIIIVPAKQMVIVRTGMNTEEQIDSKGRPQMVWKLVQSFSEW